MSAPASFISGSQAFAVSTMSRVWTFPARLARSQIMICGGVKPMTPMRIGCRVPSPSTQLALEDDVGLEVGFVSARAGAEAAPGEVGEDERKTTAGQSLVEEGQAVVELVIAQRRRLDAELVHHADDRVDVALLHAPLIGHVVAHGVALEKIAIVEEEAVRRPGTRFFYQGGDLGEAHRVVLAVAIVVVGVDEHVDVRRLEQAEVDGHGAEDAARQAGGASDRREPAAMPWRRRRRRVRVGCMGCTEPPAGGWRGGVIMAPGWRGG